jgi:type IV pilus assembly protein PilN
MIKINLFPFRAARKRENIRRQIGYYVATVVILLAVMVIYFQKLNSDVNALQSEQEHLQTELAEYQEVLRRINELDKTTQEIRAKLAVIKELEMKKAGPVHLIDEIAMAVPKDKLWLNSLNESKGSLTLTGTAMDNETVALFMTNLEKSEYVSSVDLQSAKLRNLAKFNLNVSDFVLNCKTYAYKPKKASHANNTGGKRKRKS